MRLSRIRDLMAKFGELRRTARHLGVVQPALSRTVRMTLTPAGQVS